MDNKLNKVINLLPQWSAEKILVEFAAQVFNTKIEEPLIGVEKGDHRGFALNIEDGLEFAYIKCKIPDDTALMRTSKQDLDTLVIYYFFNSKFDYIVERKIDKNVEGLLNGIIIHNYARDAMIPLRKGQEFNFVIIRIKQHILDKYFKSIADNLHKLLFVGKPVLFYENLNPDILTVLNSVGQIQLNRPISRHLIFSKTLSLLAHTYDSLLIRKKESTSIVRMPGYEKVINARNYIMSDWQKPPTIKRLSRFMGMSQTNAKILFKQVFGNTIYQYFKKKKMEIAYQMIKDTDSDMVEISKHLGYRNPSQFSADFKNHYGILPKKFSMQINKDTSDGSF